MLRILFPTFIPLTPTNLDLYLFYNLIPPFSDFSSAFKNHPTLLRSLIPHLYSDIIPTFPLSFNFRFFKKKKKQQDNFYITNKFFLYTIIFLQNPLIQLHLISASRRLCDLIRILRILSALLSLFLIVLLIHLGPPLVHHLDRLPHQQCDHL